MKIAGLVSKELRQKYEELSDEEMIKVNRAFGSVLAAFCGDAVGAYLEFSHKINDRSV